MVRIARPWRSCIAISPMVAAPCPSCERSRSAWTLVAKPQLHEVDARARDGARSELRPRHVSPLGHRVFGTRLLQRGHGALVRQGLQARDQLDIEGPARLKWFGKSLANRLDVAK